METVLDSAIPVVQVSLGQNPRRRWKREARQRGMVVYSGEDAVIGHKHLLELCEEDDMGPFEKKTMGNGVCVDMHEISAEVAKNEILKKDHSFVFLCETKLYVRELEAVARKLGFDCSLAVDCDRSSNGRRG
ncbi:hypothetical protein ACS0TY_016850 [Phlomoides rotata]